MPTAINAAKELAAAWRSVVLVTFTFPDATLLRVSTHNGDTSAGGYSYGGNDYEARIGDEEIDRLAALSEQGVDRVPSATIRMADPDSNLLTVYERPKGFMGATAELRLVLFNPITGEYSSDSLIPFTGVCEKPSVDEKNLSVTIVSKLNLSKFYLPTVPISQRCPWINPRTVAQRTEAADAESKFYPCGELRDLVTAPPCDYTTPTCTKLLRRGNSTWESEKTGSGKEYLSGTKVAWRNADVSGKFHDFVPLWLGGTSWLDCPIANSAADPGYTRGEVIVGLGKINIQLVRLNGIELSQSASGDFRWHYINQGARDGTPNPDIPYNGLGDPYGSMTAIQVLAPKAVWSPDSVPSVKVLGSVGTVESGRAIATASASGGEITITFVGANQDCAGNPPFTVTVAGCSFTAANGVWELSSFAWGPPGTITLKGGTYTGSGTGGTVAYESNGTQTYAAGGGTASGSVIKSLLKRCGLVDADLTLASFNTVDDICREAIAYVDPGLTTPYQARFSSTLVLRRRRSAAEVLRGLRQSISAMLVPDATGKLSLFVEGPLCEQQPAPIDGSNYDTAVTSTPRVGAVSHGHVAYRFDESNSWGWKIDSRSIADSPNKVQFEFTDPAQTHAVSTFSLIDSDAYMRTGIETPGGLQVQPEGIASYNHAARAARLGLNKIWWGNPTYAAQGTDWLTWQTSFRGCRLTIGQIVMVHSDRLEYQNELVRITELKPSRNFETIMIRGHFHDDNWYLDSAGNTDSPNHVRKGKPREIRPAYPWAANHAAPITSDALGSVKTFGLEMTYEAKGDSTRLARLTVTGKTPVNSVNALSPPVLGLQARTAATGGTIAGGKSYYFAVCALDSDGKQSKPTDALCWVEIAAGTNTNTVTVPVWIWGAGTSGYVIYGGSEPNRLVQCGTASGTPATITVTAIPVIANGIPDMEFNRLLIELWREDHGGVWAQTGVVADTSGDIQFPGSVFSDHAYTGRVLTVLWIADGVAVPVASYTVQSVSGDKLRVTPVPNYPTFTGGLFVCRSVPTTVGSDSTGHYVEDTYWQNNLSAGGAGLTDHDEKSKLLWIIAGLGAGYSYTILDNLKVAGVDRIYIQGDWIVTPDATSVCIIVESTCQVSKIDGPYENSDPEFLTSIKVDVDNLKEKVLLVRAIALDAEDSKGFAPLAQVREIYVPGEVMAGGGGANDGYYEIPYAATITPDLANGINQEVTVTGAMTINAPILTGGVLAPGQWVQFKLKFATPGGWAITWNAAYVGAPDLTLTTGTLSILLFTLNLDGEWEAAGGSVTGRVY